MEEKKVISVYVDPVAFEMLEKMARNLHLSRSVIVNKAIRFYCSQNGGYEHDYNEFRSEEVLASLDTK